MVAHIYEAILYFDGKLGKLLICRICLPLLGTYYYCLHEYFIGRMFVTST